MDPRHPSTTITTDQAFLALSWENAQLRAECDRLRARIERLREYLREIEDAYDDRSDQKLDFQQLRERAGWALENDK